MADRGRESGKKKSQTVAEGGKQGRNRRKIEIQPLREKESMCEIDSGRETEKETIERERE